MGHLTSVLPFLLYFLTSPVYPTGFSFCFPPWLPCQIYLVVIEQQQRIHSMTTVGCISETDYCRGIEMFHWCIWSTYQSELSISGQVDQMHMSNHGNHCCDRSIVSNLCNTIEGITVYNNLLAYKKHACIQSCTNLWPWDCSPWDSSP